MEIFVLWRLEGLEAEVVDNEEVNAGKFCKLSVKGVSCPGGIELPEHLALGGEEDVIPVADSAVTQGLGDVAFSGSAGTDNKDTDLLVYEPAGCQIHDQALVDGGVEREIELLKGFLVSEVGPSKGQCQFFLCSSGDFILNDGGQEIGVRKLFLDGLTVSAFEGIEDSGESELFEHGNEFRHGIHSGSPFLGSGLSLYMGIPTFRLIFQKGSMDRVLS